ncbi:MAG: PD-(D/E)XK nuclease domain-containing protein, partial [Desulfotomaculum sp.]|nr:PD-(D/E)XK nuclease domain-containing protein [Desulfotomaculum sp.]
AGYLTIKEVGKTPFGTTKYRLYLPNKEIKMAFDDVIIEYLTGQEPLKEKENLYAFMTAGDIEGFISTFKRIFASIPHNYWTYIKSYEGAYASIIYAYLQALGIEIIGEDVTNKGRIDLTVFIEDKIYVIEFKVIKNEKEKGTALKQIKEKKYHEKYVDERQEIYLVGMEFGEEERNIVNFEWERV